jgi:uncharacterized membrane protein required for colicin V production
MIAAAASTTSSFAFDQLSFGWFDVVLLAMIALGVFRGRKNGMTKEVLPMFQWVALVLVCGLCYEMVGQFYINLFQKMEITEAYLLGYLSLAFLVFLLFIVLKKMLVPRLTGSNFFGSMEYYLGTTSGVIRFACMTFFALALLHAPFYTAADIAATKAYNARWYGGGLKGYSGNYFPSVQSVQEAVFKNSFTGALVQNYLDVMLINTESVNGPKPAAPKPFIHIGN